MRETRFFDTTVVIVLIVGALVSVGPLYLVLTMASHSAGDFVHHSLPLLPGTDLMGNVAAAWHQARLGPKLINSLVVCAIVTAAKIALATVTAFAFVYFRTPLRSVGFAALLVTLVLPLETHIAPSYALAADVLSPLKAAVGLFGRHLTAHWTILDTYFGLCLPMAAAATGTFLFRQFFLSLPRQLVDAAKVDGVGPLRFFWDIALPLSRPNIVALAIVTFVSAWNQYLWPLLITTQPDMQTAVLALRGLAPDPQDAVPAWNVTLAGVLVIGILPVVVIACFQNVFARGFTALGPRR
jgi:sn-glycerol 3-phosphate transport system permease protein